MLAFLYLLLACLVGWAIKRVLQIDTRSLFCRISGREQALPPLWTFDFPFFLIVGTTVMTTAHYYLSCLFSLVLPSGTNPLFASNLALLPLPAIFVFFFLRSVIKKRSRLSWRSYFSDTDPFFWKTMVFFFCFSLLLIFYTFFVLNGHLFSGATVFSDFAPHTAMIHSFSKGSNFPTQYPHFANDGIQYHFMFYYLCGNLQYLGLRIDLAMNIPSILGILSFLSLLGCLGVLLTRRKGVFFLAPFMLFFRSSFAVFSYLGDLAAKEGATFGRVLADILGTDIFIGQTLHDDWGLWSMNVYANQRHFLWGFSALLIILFLFLPSVGVLTLRGGKITRYLTDPDLWKINRPRELLLALLLAACLPYWHGSVLVALLCILFLMAFFSKDRLAYLAVAVTGVASAVVQARFFSGGAQNVFQPEFLWGFLASDPSFIGVVSYLFQVLGISFLLMLVLPFFQKKVKSRVLMAACFVLVLFTLCVSLTPDVTVNHKYVIIAVALANIFIADMFCNVMQFVRERFRLVSSWVSKAIRSALSVILAVLLSFSLFATGFVELIGYVNQNTTTVIVDLNSPLTAWIEENTQPGDVFLAAPYHMNEFFFSGRKLFFGWTYYSWSAGHDTASREVTVREMFLGYGGDKEEFLRKVKEQGIRYVIIDDTLLYQTDYEVDTLFFENNFEEAVRFPSIRNTIIYRLY